MYFNPLIPLNSFEGVTGQDDLRRIKYGVISEANAVKDLRDWEKFGLAGRLQKPVMKVIKDSPSIEEAMDINIQNALNLGIFMHYRNINVTLEQLFTTIVGFSMKGDIRMSFKMENPDKVRNLV